MRILTAIGCCCVVASFASAGEWTRLPSLPDPNGVAAPFVGVLGSGELLADGTIRSGELIVAGGANFPDKKPWEGGTKVWHDVVYALDRPEGEWRVVGKLPRPLAYGLGFSHPDGLICIGGSDSKRNYADVFRLNLVDGKLTVRELPSLPRPIADACGAIAGSAIYVAGGRERPDSSEALATVYRLELKEELTDWEEIESIPGGGRMLAIAGGGSSGFNVVGGVDLIPGEKGPVRRYLRDGYWYTEGEGWRRIADLPYPVAAAPSPGPAAAFPWWFHVLGGDDGSQVGVAPEDHRGFCTTLLRYNVSDDLWQARVDGRFVEVFEGLDGFDGDLAASRVTTWCTTWNDRNVIASGEVRPGVRSPEVWTFDEP